MGWSIEQRVSEWLAWPAYVDVVRGDMRRLYAPVRRAERVRVTVDEARAIGHDECGGCGRVLPPLARWCPWCGAEIGGE